MPTDGENDYRTTALPELRDALRNIDAEAYPVNYANLCAEIESRAAGTHAEPPPPDPEIERSVLKWMDLLMGGIVALVGVASLVRGEIYLPSRYHSDMIHLTGPAAWIAGGGALVVAVAIMSGAVDDSEPPRIGLGLRWTLRITYFLIAVAVLWKGGASRA